MRSVSGSLPKPMLPVDGRPFLEYVILSLARYGFRRLIISTGHRTAPITGYFGDGSHFGVSITYKEESSPLGTAGAVREAALAIEDEWFLALNGDSYLDLDPNALITDAKTQKALVTMALTRVEDAERFGTVVVGRDGWVSAIREKERQPSVPTINAGIYACSRQIIPWITASGPASLEHATLPAMAAAHRLRGVVSDGYFVDMGTPESYELLRRNPAMLLAAVRGPHGQRVAAGRPNVGKI